MLCDHQAVFNELCNMLDPGKPAFVPKKGKPNVIMFVGLQGEPALYTSSLSSFIYAFIL
jgi:signal recognition particle GTPase